MIQNLMDLIFDTLAEIKIIENLKKNRVQLHEPLPYILGLE